MLRIQTSLATDNVDDDGAFDALVHRIHVANRLYSATRNGAAPRNAIRYNNERVPSSQSFMDQIIAGAEHEDEANAPTADASTATEQHDG